MDNHDDVRVRKHSVVSQLEFCDREHYASDAIFIDPIMKVHGHRDISLEFYSLIKLFNTVITPQETTVTSTDTPSIVKVCYPHAMPCLPAKTRVQQCDG